MRASRLLSILITLQLRGRVSARSLAERFEVSKRTILRDMDELSAAGVPIYAERGAGGGFALLDGFRTDLTGLDDAEREALFLAGLPQAARDLGLDQPAAAARLKLAAAVGGADGGIAERFHLDPDDWYRRRAPAPHLRAVAAAVWNGRRLSIDYQSWRRRAWQEVDPLGLVLKGGEWYLVATARRGPATYRMANILAAVPLDGEVVRPADFDLAACWTDLRRTFEEGRLRSEACIRVSPGALDRIDRLGGDAADCIRAAIPDATGWRTVSIPIESITYDAPLLLGFADEIEVLAPAALRDEIARLGRRIVSLYETGCVPREAGDQATGSLG